MKTVLFLGPTLAAERAASVPGDAVVWPPVARGDVLRACQAGADRIAIVDGYFDQVPSVMHKEILYAIERGIPVFGSSSMGALRAAELHTFGMVGVGRIFEMYRDGVLEDDDEVAVAHGPAESGYRSLSDAMVDIRDRVEAAVAGGLVGHDSALRLLAIAKSLPYPQRSFRALAELAMEDAPRLDHPGRLAAFLNQPHASLKQRDAIDLLRHIANGANAPVWPPLHVERTVFFERLRLTIEHQRPGADNPAPAGPGEVGDALLGLLAEERADLLLLPLADDELAHMLEDVRAAHGLATPEDLERWLRERDVSLEELTACLREQAALRKLSHLYAPEIERRRATRARLPRL